MCSAPIDVRILGPEDDVSAIRGFTVVVDVFRAFTTACYVYVRNPGRYFVTDSIDEALRLKSACRSPVLIGERDGWKIEGFDFGNSPTEVQRGEFSGRDVIHTTTAGTKGVLAQPPGNEVVVGSFVNCRAIVDRVRSRAIWRVNIYCTAPRNRMNGEEDYLFAEYLAKRLRGEGADFAAIVSRLRDGSAMKFSDTGIGPYTDFLYCMEIDRFPFVLARRPVEGERHVAELVEAR